MLTFMHIYAFSFRNINICNFSCRFVLPHLEKLKFATFSKYLCIFIKKSKRMLLFIDIALLEMLKYGSFYSHLCFII